MDISFINNCKVIYENGQWFYEEGRKPIRFPTATYQNGVWIREDDSIPIEGYISSYEVSVNKTIGGNNMTVSSMINGHKIIFVNNEWVYADDKTPYDNQNPRGCINCGCNCITGNKTLDISEVKGATKNISDLKVYGDGDTWKLLCKASSDQEGWMKSTKVLNVNDGCLVQVTTQQRNPDGSYAVAEAVTYVPSMNIDINSEPRKIVPITYKTVNTDTPVDKLIKFMQDTAKERELNNNNEE